MEDSLDSRIDDVFFEHLFRTLATEEDEARADFEAQLEAMAWDELQRAIDRSPHAYAQRFKAISEAEGMFRACCRKRFPDLAARAASREVPA